MGQFSVQFALCHCVLLISTFFFPSHPSTPEALPGSGAGDITNSKQWLSAGANWPSDARFASGPLACSRYGQGGQGEMPVYGQSALLRKCCPIAQYLIRAGVFCFKPDK